MKELIFAVFLILGTYAREPTKPTSRSSSVEDYADSKYGYGMPYEFGYSVKDPTTYNDYGHRESSDGRRVSGEYRVLLPDGRTQIVTYYVEGDSGFVADVRYEGKAEPYSGPSFKPSPKPVPYLPRPKPLLYRPPERRPPPPTGQPPYPPRPLYPPRERPSYPPRARPPYPPRARPPYPPRPKPSYPSRSKPHTGYSTDPSAEQTPPTTQIPSTTVEEDTSAPTQSTKDLEDTTLATLYRDEGINSVTPPSSEYGLKTKYVDPAPAHYEKPASPYVEQEPIYKGFYAHYNKPEPNYVNVRGPDYYRFKYRPTYLDAPIYTTEKPEYKEPIKELDPEIDSDVVTQEPITDIPPVTPNVDPELETPQVGESEASKPIDQSGDKIQPHDGYNRRPYNQHAEGRLPHDGYSVKPYLPRPRPRPRGPHPPEERYPQPYPAKYPPRPYEYQSINRAPHDGYTPKSAPDYPLKPYQKPFVAQNYLQGPRPYKPVDDYPPKPYDRSKPHGGYTPNSPQDYPRQRYPPRGDGPYPDSRRTQPHDGYSPKEYEPRYRATEPPPNHGGKLFYPNISSDRGVYKFREPERRSIAHRHSHLPNAPDCHLIHGDFGARISNRRVDMLRAKLNEQ